MANLVDHKHDIHSYSCQYLQMANDQVKTQYDCLTNSVEYQKGDSVAVSPNPHEGEVTQAPVLMVGPTRGNHLNQ